ncbi:MAG: biosynthetic arginine decarboxylase [Planctomycetota bacterium]|jgi:arginine decarboxylase
MAGWSVKDSLDLYNVPLWSAGFFGANERGHVVATPKRTGGPEIDLKELVDDVRERGYELPLLIRFNDILRERVAELGECFQRAIGEYGYGGSYRGVYPIKVNQQAHIVEQLLDCGREFHLGLEVGSRPELLAALALADDPESLIVCNGYKDEAYIETALLAQKLGRRIILVVDRAHEIATIIRVVERSGIKPLLGIRAKLQTRGVGRWAESGGSLSKFGLSTREMMRAVNTLRDHDLLDSLQLLHFHMGSQVPSIRVFKEALREASRIFVELAKLGAPMRYLDTGGGLAVDYDGSNTNFHSSMNYSVQEYANDVVAAIQESCDKEGVPHPVIMSESGRALVAHHAVLVFDVLDRHTVTPGDPEAPPADAPDVVRNLFETWQSIQRRNLLEPYHDAISLRDEAQQLFNLGFLDLEGRAQAERLFFTCCMRLARLLTHQPRVPEELEGLERALADTYFCNFSVFQSMPDSWAVGQLFPILPIHRLEERPTSKAVLVDLTCDSDGKIDKFVDLHDVKDVLDLHTDDGSPYYLGAFLVGAYQEILGDLHNLFGDTNAIHVTVENGGYSIDHVVTGDTVGEVLGYVEFDPRDLIRRVRRACESAVRAGRMSPRETRALLRRYEEGLNGYTYLASDDEVPPRASEAKPRTDSSVSGDYPETPRPRTESPAHPDA